MKGFQNFKNENRISQDFSDERKNVKSNNNRQKKLKNIFILSALILIVLFATILVMNNITSVQEKMINANGGEDALADTRANSYNIYGLTPFTEEYSIGSFCQATAVNFGTGFAHEGKQSNGNKRMIGTNTSKNSNVYRDAIGGFKMGTEVYDVRTYFWLIEGDDYAVWGSYAYGAYSKSQSEGDTFTDGYVSATQNTVIGLEIHFYKSGTLATSNPQEVTVKGIGCFTDNDDGEGYEFVKGVNGVWLTRNTTIKSGSAITDQLYQTPFGNAWIGTATADSLDTQKIYYQFDSSPSVPLTVRHYGLSGYHSGVSSEVHNVTYHIEGNIPDGVTYPEDPIYVADYGTYTIIDSLSKSGYTFKGWNRDSINGTNVSGKKMAPITADIDVYGKFTMDIPVKKTWIDSDNQDGKRPSSVTVTLYLDGKSTGKTITLNSSNDWSGTFTGLDVYDNYTVKENYISNYSSTVMGSAKNGFTILNTHIPETTSVSVSKIWSDNNNQDGKRPTSVKMTLYADGKTTGKTVTLNSSNSWKGTFSNIAKYSGGKEIIYTVKETTVSGYTSSVDTSAKNSFTVTNTHTPETMDIPVSKTWSDSNNQDGLRPTSVKITLYANGSTTGKTLILNNSNSWKGTFSDIAKYSGGNQITYTIKEDTVSGYTNSISGNVTNGFIVTNIHIPETISIPVSKVWSDNNNQDGKRASSVTITLYANGETTGKKLTLNSSNSWKGTFSSLPKYSAGKQITYTVKEDTVANYTNSISGNVTSGFTVTNTHTPETINIPVTKVWNDNNNQDGKRTSSVTITLYANNISTGKNLTLNSSNSWKGTFSGVAKYSGGKEITYTVKEDAVANYTNSITGSVTSGFTVTNTHTPETIDIPVTKVWNDNNNQDGKRTSSVTITLYADGKTTGKILTLNTSNSWKGTFNDVAKYSSGKEINYTIQENSVSGYSVSITGNVTNGFTVTNTHIPETVNVPVTKIWNHTNNIYKIPQEVKVQVKNGNSVVAEKVLNSGNKSENDNTWTWTFTNLPKYQNQGQEINYTVDEIEVNSGDLKYYKKQINGKTITNTYNGPVINASKEVKTEYGLAYAVEGEKIIYTIRVKNTGDLAQDVIVKDNVPEGSTFVTGSVKINQTADQAKTEKDLTNGLKVNVPANGETTVSFEVTVNKLGTGVLTRTIVNKATVNKNPDNSESTDEPTNEVTTTVNKPNLKYNKSSSPASGSTVKEGDEITYTIHLMK